jgi:secreted trypsin-like serine protease
MGNVTLSHLEGSPLQIVHGSWEAMKQHIEARLGRPLTAAEETKYHTMFDTPLLGGYEAFFAAHEGDVQLCNGDSGGPLLRKVDDRVTVFGVASWTVSLDVHTNLCDGGMVYATFGPSAVALLDHVMAFDQENATCGTETLGGRCDGNTAVRCLGADEGGPRVTRTRCDDVNLVCAVVGGRAECRDPTE